MFGFDGTLGTIGGPGVGFGFYWGTRKNGKFDFGAYTKQNIGAAAGAELTLEFSRDGLPFTPEVFTDDLAGTGMDIDVTMLAFSPELNLLKTADGPKIMVSGGFGPGVSGEITGNFVQTYSVVDGINSIIEKLAGSIPAIDFPPIFPDYSIIDDPSDTPFTEGLEEPWEVQQGERLPN